MGRKSGVGIGMLDRLSSQRNIRERKFEELMTEVGCVIIAKPNLIDKIYYLVINNTFSYIRLELLKIYSTTFPFLFKCYMKGETLFENSVRSRDPCLVSIREVDFKFSSRGFHPRLLPLPIVINSFPPRQHLIG
jgi:hypothetical protein